MATSSQHSVTATPTIFCPPLAARPECPPARIAECPSRPDTWWALWVKSGAWLGGWIR